MLMLQQQHSMRNKQESEIVKLTSHTLCYKKKAQTLATLAAQAKGRKRCGTAAVANSTPAPNSIRRSPANLNYSTSALKKGE